MTEDVLKKKQQALRDHIRSLGSLAIGFSGGVDSAFLVKTAHEVLGDSMIAVTVSSAFFPAAEMEEAVRFCETEGIPHRILPVDVLAIEDIRLNPENRCYYCKKNLFQKILQLAEENGMAYTAEGSNEDDMGDYRPGMQALKELGIKSPLREEHLTKAEIRELSRRMGLPTWDKPSRACLASRIPYGEPVSEEKLKRIEKAEQLLSELGFSQLRVRAHGRLARIEVPSEELGELLLEENRLRIIRKFREIGFIYVTMDLQGFRSGSANEVLKENK